ncbi:helix-turn-helix domain-containing protein [Paraburkholderia sp. BR10872]|uniref:helix-turn-helix domain-containing protein n=1 Tax=Paraburkholderia sp. BR10872 TaxID=3236989 RepID=UPI0034D19AD3
MRTVRVHPEQRVTLTRVAACVRFVYNYMLRLRSDTWYFRQTRIGYPETVSALTVISGLREYRFLAEAPPKSLDEALRDLEEDFRAFYVREAHYPRFRGMEAPEPNLSESRDYPTANRCHDCGYFLEQIPRTPEWTCPDCGVVHRTSENTARNVEAVARSIAFNASKLTDKPP